MLYIIYLRRRAFKLVSLKVDNRGERINAFVRCTQTPYKKRSITKSLPGTYIDSMSPGSMNSEYTYNNRISVGSDVLLILILILF